MKIESIILRDFGTISFSEIVPSKGINLISGGNGQGKSTILKAIVLVLFGYSKEKLSDLIKWGKTQFSILMKFEHLGIKFETNFSYSEKNGSEKFLSIHLKDNIDEYKGSDATNKLKEYFDPKLSLASVVSYEGEIDLITVRPSERREHLKKIYNLDFKKEADDIDVSIKEFETELTKLQTEKTILEGKEYKFVELEESDLPFLKWDIDSKKTELTELQIKRDAYNKDLSTFNSKKEVLLDEVKHLEKNLDFVMKGLDTSISKIRHLIWECETKIVSLTDLKEKAEKLNEFETNTNIQIKSLFEQIEVTNSERKRLPADIKVQVMNAELDVVLLNNLKSELKYLSDKFEAVKKGSCPVCGNEFSTNDIPFYQDAVEKMQLQVSEVEKRVEDFKEKYDDYQKNVEKNHQIDSFVEKTKNEISILELKLSSEKEKAKIAIDNSISNIKELREKINQYEIDIQDTEKSKSETEDRFKKDKENIEENLKEISILIDVTASYLGEADYEIECLSNDIRMVDDFLLKEDLIKKSNENLKKEMDSDKNRVATIQKSIEDFDTKINNYKKAKTILQKEFPAFVIETLISELENEINNFLQCAYSRYELKIKEEKDTLNIFYSDEEKDVSLASGYEKQVFSIAYKMALASLQNLGFAIFDEIDSQASEENSILLYETISKMSKNFDQIFIITHRENTKDFLKSEYNSTTFEVENGKVLKGV